MVFILIMCLFGFYQKFQDDLKHRNMHRIEKSYDSFPPPPSGPHVKRHAIQHRLPLPVLINLILLMFILGVNTAVFISFRSHRDRQKMKLLENIRLQDELKYLKAQINPHFFMNVLNNIHAMMDVDTPKAQNMVIELSKLMRYVLYDGDSQMTTLISEMKFLSSYVSLMRLRYSENKVKIKMDVPELIPNNISIPPLLFIPFVENAFKHGISYRRVSIIEISVEENGENVIFRCSNTKLRYKQRNHAQGGLGLQNVRKRLELIYGNSYSLDIKETEEDFNVTLNIPCL